MDAGRSSLTMAMKARKHEESLAPGIRRRGNSMQLDFYFEGIRCREALRLDPNIPRNVKLAEKMLAAISFEIALGTFNYSKHFPNSKKAAEFGHSIVPNNLTVAEVVEWHLGQVEGRLREKTMKGYRGYLKNHIRPGIGKILARKLKPSQVNEWLTKNPNQAKAKNKWLALLKPAFAAALANELIERDPVAAVKTLPVPKKEPNPYDIEQVDLILNSFTDENACCFYTVGFWTGLSPSERLGLKWENVELVNHCIYIREARVDNTDGETKNHFRRRRVDLLPPAESAIRKLRKLHPNSTWVFNDPRTGTVWKDHAVRKHWTNALKTAHLPRERSYVTRHTYASILLSIGVPLSWIKQQMGHSNYRMLEEVYARWIEIAPEQRKRILGWFLKMSEDGHIPEALVPYIRTIQQA